MVIGRIEQVYADVQASKDGAAHRDVVELPGA
jgi:hypothetical protein